MSQVMKSCYVWFYQLASILSNGLSYLLHLCLHDMQKLDEGSLPVYRVVEMWSNHVLSGPYVDRDVDTLLVFDYSKATRDYLNQHNVKYVGALHPNRLKLQCDMLRKRFARSETVLRFLIRLLCSTTRRLSMDRKRPRLELL